MNGVLESKMDSRNGLWMAFAEYGFTLHASGVDAGTLNGMAVC